MVNRCKPYVWINVMTDVNSNLKVEAVAYLYFQALQLSILDLRNTTKIYVRILYLSFRVS